MDQDINQMVAQHVVLVRKVVEAKADIRHWTIRGRALKSCPCNASQGKCR
jgi:hypothetical protein